MLLASSPAKVPAVFAGSAGSPYINNPVPIPSQIGITNGAASYTDGFPPNCFVPYAAGGAGPFGADFNGILFALSGGIRWQQAGGPIFYDSTFSGEIGGYPNTAILKSATQQNVFWESTVDNNTSNPDTGGANWIKIGAKGSLCNIQIFAVSGTYTPTPGATSAIIYGVGGGGAGGGTAACSGSQGAAGGGGGTGAFARIQQTTLGVESVTIGSGGTGVSGGNGNAGGATSIGSWLSCPGGFGGAAGGATAGPSITAVGGAAGAPTIGGGATAIWATAGATGLNGFVLSDVAIQSGAGGNSMMGGGGNNTNGIPSGDPGNNAVGYGAGGSGAASQPSTGPFIGGGGSSGILIIEEYF